MTYTDKPCPGSQWVEILSGRAFLLTIDDCFRFTVQGKLSEHAWLLGSSESKGQIISEQICGVLKFSEKVTKYCQDFCPSL
jgi:hypothetical protein